MLQKCFQFFSYMKLLSWNLLFIFISKTQYLKANFIYHSLFSLKILTLCVVSLFELVKWCSEQDIHSGLKFYDFKSIIQFVLLSFLTLGNDFMSFVSINQLDLLSGIFRDFCPSHFFSQEKPVISTK